MDTERSEQRSGFSKRRLIMFLFDMLIYIIVGLLVYVVYPNVTDDLPPDLIAWHMVFGFVCLFVGRQLLKIYLQIWRYAGPKEYIRFLISDAFACAVFVLLRRMFFSRSITLVRSLSLFTMNLLCCIAVRFLYQWAYQSRMSEGVIVRLARTLLKVLTGVSFADETRLNTRVSIAIVGAGSIGVMLAEELIQNPRAVYQPVCFVDVDREKVGREIYGIPVISGERGLHEKLQDLSVQEIVFALPNADPVRRLELFRVYEGFGYKIRTYDYPTLNESGRRQIHDFAVEDLLFRGTAEFLDEKTMSWYQGKTVMITGGGGSIGSELARQIAKCSPARLVILDVYENGVYDIQQELKTLYGDRLNIQVEIASVCCADSIDKIFQEYTPDIVLHAAAHKHVPLMERNVIEAVLNNVFGTLNVVNACEKYGVGKFIMISTDKAVNPTNVMGATKRVCEMIIQSRGGGGTKFCATRFGNVLGSNGSVIPLFRKQIAAGGPVTITDKRIIRYFMTIPEASQLVMTSGAMAKNGELYVLDMGKPVKILDLAENMIRLSGFEPYKDIDIVEIGLRPGEKLYEELLIKTEEMDKTDNSMIFVERDRPLSREDIDAKLEILRQALATHSNRTVRQALMQVVPTYHTPEEVNRRAVESEEMKLAGV